MGKKKIIKRVFLIILIVIVALILVLLIAIPFLVMGPATHGHFAREQFASTDFGIESESVQLNTSDQIQLAAWRTKAVGDTKGTVIVLSGIQNPSVTAFFGYAKMLSDNGWDSLLIEMRARGLSEGNELGFALTEWHDVVAGVDFLETDPTIKDLPIVALGTSMGAATCITAAGEDPRIDGVISLSSFSSWPDAFVDNLSAAGVPAFFAVWEKPFISAYMAGSFGFSESSKTPLNALKNFGDRPILFMQSTQDSQVPYASFERLVKRARKYQVNMTAFIRAGDEHFICYDDDQATPTKDIEFSSTVLNFLADNF